MRTTLVLGMVSLVWLAAGVLMIAVPAWASRLVQRKLADPFSRFLLLEGAPLAGVLAVLGRSMKPRSWLWIAVGGLATATALVLFGLSTHARDRLCAWWCGSSPWLARLAGLVAVILATLLASEVIRKGGS